MLKAGRGHGPGEMRPVLSDTSTAEDLEDEVEWIQTTLFGLLNEHTRRITICVRSKRWWNDDVRDRRMALRRIKRRRRRELEKEETVRVARREPHRAIRRAKRECLEEFLNRVEGDEVWAVTRYTKPQRSAAVPAIRHQGATADRHEYCNGGLHGAAEVG